MAKDPKDHGEFMLHSPDEDVRMVQLGESAERNPHIPGQAWTRFEGTRVVDGRTVKGVKVFHMDLAAEKLTVTEEWDGVETARKTIPLGVPSIPTGSQGPVSPPDPGSNQPGFFRSTFLSAELYPEDELRQWVMERAAKDVFEGSVLPRRIRLFGEGFQEIVNLPQWFAPGVAPGTGATLRALATRPGVERRFVEGWSAGIDDRDTAWILEVCEDGAWWFATRPFDRRPGQIGLWKGAWAEQTDVDPDAIADPFRAICVPPDGEEVIDVGEPRRPEAPEIGMFCGETLPANQVPSTASDVAAKVGRIYERDLQTGMGSGEVRVVVFRGVEWETWRLIGEFPMGLDDVIRAIAARGEPPTSIALARLGILPFDGDAYRALITDGEVQGRRFTRALLIMMDATGSVIGHRIVGHDHGEVGDDGWIGVAPITDMSFVLPGAAEA
jgi:hypothetical protein